MPCWRSKGFVLGYSSIRTETIVVCSAIILYVSRPTSKTTYWNTGKTGLMKWKDREEERTGRESCLGMTIYKREIYDARASVSD